jgi:7-keto-8-aminopelargonate synthetase-like enzyme
LVHFSSKDLQKGQKWENIHTLIGTTSQILPCWAGNPGGNFTPRTKQKPNKMENQLSRQLRVVNEHMQNAVDQGLAHVEVQNDRIDGRTILVNGQEMVNFASCSYLGLETHPLLKQGAATALENYGTQFSASRAYVSAGLYAELESKLAGHFGRPVIVTPGVTMGHLAALPVLVQDDDVVILDYQVHTSVQMAAQLLRGRGVRVDRIRHSRMDMLESRIQKYQKTHRRVWYLGDGVYSMYGDLAPVAELKDLLARYECLHLYLDDAHGFSCLGEKGLGHVWPALGGHPRVYVAVSLNKSFAAAGGAIVFPDSASHRLVRNCGSTLIFSGPIQPPMLGAAIASLDMHRSPEGKKRQEELQRRIALFHVLSREKNLPLACYDLSPIKYVQFDTTEKGYHLTHLLQQSGYFVSIAAYPSVAQGTSGLRITLTNHQTFADIARLVGLIAHHLTEAPIVSVGLPSNSQPLRQQA